MAQLTDTPFTIVGIGGAVGDATVPNSVFAQRFQVSEDWIVGACGIRERSVGGGCVSLGAAAAVEALADAQVDAEAVDLLILATSSPEFSTPANAALVHRALGLRDDCLAFDISSACSGFLVGMAASRAWLAAGAETVLIVGSDTITKYLDPDDRNTSILFGDGAGAIVVSSSGAGRMLAVDQGTVSSGIEHLTIPYGGLVSMNGREVFRSAVSTVSASVLRTLDELGVTPADVDLLVPHQANSRITAAIAQRVGVDPARVLEHLEQVGNTSAGTIGLTLRAHRHRLRAGQFNVLTGFGAGISYATVALRWG